MQISCKSTLAGKVTGLINPSGSKKLAATHKIFLFFISNCSALVKISLNSNLNLSFSLSHFAPKTLSSLSSLPNDSFAYILSTKIGISNVTPSFLKASLSSLLFFLHLCM